MLSAEPHVTAAADASRDLEQLRRALSSSNRQLQAQAFADLSAFTAGTQQHVAALCASGVLLCMLQVLPARDWDAGVQLAAAEVMRNAVRWRQPAHVDHAMKCGIAEHLVNFLAGNEIICGVALEAIESIVSVAQHSPGPSASESCATVRRQSMKLYPDGWSAGGRTCVAAASPCCASSGFSAAAAPAPATAGGNEHVAQLMKCGACAAILCILARETPVSPVAQLARRILDHFPANSASAPATCSYMNHVIGRSIPWPTGADGSAQDVSVAYVRITNAFQFVVRGQALCRRQLHLRLRLPAASPARRLLPSFHLAFDHVTACPEASERLLVRVRFIESAHIAVRLATAAASVAAPARALQLSSLAILQRVCWRHCRDVQVKLSSGACNPRTVDCVAC
jgi:hypothetical protein